VIDVLTLDGDRIAAVTGFVTFDLVDLPGGRQVTAAEVFARFGLPARLP
jgi:hypothetical protein